MAKPIPNFDLENDHHGPVCGIDEVGVGPLAGPVIAAAVFTPKSIQTLDFFDKIRDSKTLSLNKRNELFIKIKAACAVGIGQIEVDEIDQINILQARLKAMRIAYQDLTQKTGKNMDMALVDGNRCPKLPCPSTLVIKGDTRSCSIAAASIIAKVTRDQLMTQLAQQFPTYGWGKNMGYGTKQHLQALNLYGPTPHHRHSFAPVRNSLKTAA